MHSMIGDVFVNIDGTTAILVVVLGFIGGVLSGFIGSGGAFFMTPGMMNLGVSGVVAVASNITHKFGKALVGSRKHAKLGNVDKRLAIFLLASALVGEYMAVMVNSYLFQEAGGHGGGKSAASDLYISGIFIGVLTFVAISMLCDVMRPASEGQGPSKKIAEFLGRLNLKPVVRFPVSDVDLSFWVLIPVGLATGYLAGTIGVGGFIGVPAMIYVFGIPTAVAAGTELYMAVFMGAWGALNYAWQGFVDVRLTMLLFLGSLVGIHIGVYGVKVVSEKYIRLTTGVIILLCVISRAVAVPVYCRQLEWVAYNPDWDAWFKGGSTVMLFASGIGGAAIILYNVMKAHVARRKIQTTLLVSRPAPESAKEYPA